MKGERRTNGGARSLVYLRRDVVHSVHDEDGDGRVEEEVGSEVLAEEVVYVVEDLYVLHDGAHVQPAGEAQKVPEDKEGRGREAREGLVGLAAVGVDERVVNRL